MRAFRRQYLQPFLLFLVAALVSSGCSRDFTVVKAQPTTRIAQTERAQYDPHRAPSPADEQLHEGLILFRAGRNREARQMFIKAIAADPERWSGHYYLARLMIREDEYAAAIDELYIGLDLAPDEPRTRSSIYRSLAECLELQGRLSQAELHYRTALNLFPESIPARQGLSRLQALRQSTPQ